MTHSELVQMAARWLARKYPVVITEMASQCEEPDAIGFNGVVSAVVECKASRADFLADRNKTPSRMGYYRWYLVPDGMVKADEVPPGWGLLYAIGRRVGEVLGAGDGHADDRNTKAEVGLLVSCIRRIGKAAPSSVSVKCYTIETKNRATLGIAVDA